MPPPRNAMPPAAPLRPAVPYIVLDDNSRIELDRDCVIGREPHDSDAVQRGFRPIRIEDRTGEMSRAHAEIRRINGEVCILDRASTNGVFLRGSAQQPWTKLAPWEPTVWLPGTSARIGGRTLRLEMSAPQQPPRDNPANQPGGVASPMRRAAGAYQDELNHRQPHVAVQGRGAHGSRRPAYSPTW
jgi:RND superfamily putative drug exporter